ncbi:MAG: CDP-alcohol phosphatidyltransferase family protein [Bacteroidales bacterium]|nr:CDP-alcohol phosphatidyltransferase family protein [Bacteroidales bacterium]
MSIKKYIPNSITSLNLICGVISVSISLSSAATGKNLLGDSNLYLYPACLIFLGAVFDFFDGFAARWLHVSSDIGKELDSLADLITFGFAPAGIYTLYLSQNYYSTLGLGIYFPLILVLFSALRLAKFNVDTRQTESFIGLTTTATALFTASLFLAMALPGALSSVKLDLWLIVVMVAAFSFLLVSEIPMFSLKIKHFGWKGNELRVVLLATGLISLIILGVGGIAFTILLYILFSLVMMLIKK